MGKIKDKSGSIQTVGELKECLAKFPDEMPLECELCNSIQIYRDEPMECETRGDRATGGRLCIQGDDEF